MVFRWRNDPFIIAHGSFHRAIEWGDHEKWFAETVRGDRRRMFIILQKGSPIGQIRFDRSQSDCVISVYLMSPFIGRGWGTEAIRVGCEMIFETWDVDRLIACVRLDNPAGRAAFLKAAFQEDKTATSCPPEHYSLVLTREGWSRRQTLAG
jgi:RimJ/RimL family protein N-acetyltransferase